MIKSYFGDIRNIIVEDLKKAKFDIYVVVAWLTDVELFTILLDKVKNSIEVTIILVDDSINRNNGFDYDSFVERGGTIYWSNHHHKFCIIDRRTLITGSYNWTYAAHKRVGRENILVIKDNDALIENYSLEYQILKKNAQKHVIHQEEKIRFIEKSVIVEVEKPVIVEKIVQKLVIDTTIRKAGWFDSHLKRVEWWKSLNDQWKSYFVAANYINNPLKPKKEELKYIFEADQLTFNESKVISDYSGLKNLSRLKKLYGLKLDVNSKQLLEQILTGIEIIDC